MVSDTQSLPREQQIYSHYLDSNRHTVTISTATDTQSLPQQRQIHSPYLYSSRHKFNSRHKVPTLRTTEKQIAPWWQPTHRQNPDRSRHTDTTLTVVDAQKLTWQKRTHSHRSRNTDSTDGRRKKSTLTVWLASVRRHSSRCCCFFVGTNQSDLESVFCLWPSFYRLWL